MMTEFLHEVVKKREREQEHRNLMPRSYLDELSRQMQESYNRMTAQAAGAVYATDPSRVANNLTTIHGIIAVRSRSVNQVDAWIRLNIERHADNLAHDNYHSHEEGNMQWVLEEVSYSNFIAGLGRRQFTYSCSLCGQRVICSESISREAVEIAGLAV